VGTKEEEEEGGIEVLMFLGELVGIDIVFFDSEAELEISEPPENFLLGAGNSCRSLGPELFWLGLGPWG
jgi:hypothetical protein